MSIDYTDEQPPKAGIDSPNETNFNPNEAAPEKQRKYRRLWFYNENLRRDRNNTNSTEVRRREQNHILDAISSSLELPDYQHKEAQHIVEQTNFTDSVEGQYLSIETYCFAICVLVWNEYNSSVHRVVLPDTQNIEPFKSLKEELGISDTKLEQALEELEHDVIENV
jgi:hypothetical protein